MWISSLMRESQEQTQILRQHHLGLQVQAEVIKTVVNQQQQQKDTGKGPTVSDADDDQDPDHLGFLGGKNPNTGPPIVATGRRTGKRPRALKNKEDPRKN